MDPLAPGIFPATSLVGPVPLPLPDPDAAASGGPDFLTALATEPREPDEVAPPDAGETDSAEDAATAAEFPESPIEAALAAWTGVSSRLAAPAEPAPGSAEPAVETRPEVVARASAQAGEALAVAPPGADEAGTQRPAVAAADGHADRPARNLVADAGVRGERPASLPVDPRLTAVSQPQPVTPAAPVVAAVPKKTVTDIAARAPARQASRPVDDRHVTTNSNATIAPTAQVNAAPATVSSFVLQHYAGLIDGKTAAADRDDALSLDAGGLDAALLPDLTASVARPDSGGPTTPGARAAESHAPAISRQIAAAAVRADSDGVELVLAPEELGRLRMRVQHGEHSPIVTIWFDSPDVLDAARRHADLLLQDLHDSGLENATLDLRSGSGRDERPDDGAAGSAPAATGQDSVAAAPAPTATPQPRDRQPGDRLVDIRV